MRFDAETAAIRFGCGLSPSLGVPSGIDEMLHLLDQPDRIARVHRIEDFDTFRNRMKYNVQIGRLRRAAKTPSDRKEAEQAQRRIRRLAAMEEQKWLVSHLLRRAWTRDGLRERLVQFWSDHFTATGKGGVLRSASLPYVESAIRPHVSGRFEDLLVSAVTHPLMLHYLDQKDSAGPTSQAARRRNAGMNENLAREILELHTLGVDGPYTQTDVRELAELLTGLSFTAADGRVFIAPMAEPGAETVLGRRYGGGPPGLGDIRAALKDLARHPSTAAHLARKLAVHFVSDTPSEALVAAMTERYLDSGGHLRGLYEALLSHPDAWAPTGNVKQPLDMIGSALRALAVPAERFRDVQPQQVNTFFRTPMRVMGHDFARPDGPDGLPEEDAAWISPQGLAARLNWAMRVPSLLMRDLPDPRDFAATALGRRLPSSVAFAAGAAETRWEGIGIVLVSPAFQTM